MHADKIHGSMQKNLFARIKDSSNNVKSPNINFLYTFHSSVIVQTDIPFNQHPILTYLNTL